MIELIWAWRLWLGQIRRNDIPEEIRKTALKIAESLPEPPAEVKEKTTRNKRVVL